MSAPSEGERVEHDLNDIDTLSDWITDFYLPAYREIKDSWEKVTEDEIIAEAVRVGVLDWRKMNAEIDAEWDEPRAPVAEPSGANRYKKDGPPFLPSTAFEPSFPVAEQETEDVLDRLAHRVRTLRGKFPNLDDSHFLEAAARDEIARLRARQPTEDVAEALREVSDRVDDVFVMLNAYAKDPHNMGGDVRSQASISPHAILAEVYARLAPAQNRLAALRTLTEEGT